MDYKPQTDEFFDLLGALSKEVETVAHAHPGKENGSAHFPEPSTLAPLDRRSTVRSVFAFIEAMTYRLKRLALILPGAKAMTVAERAISEEEDYSLGSDGQARARPAKLQLISNLRFSFAIFSRIQAATFTPDYSGRGWQALQRALLVRDRITHPKKVVDLEIADNEVKDAIEAYLWMHKQVTLLIASVMITILNELQRVNSEVERLKGQVGKLNSR